MEQTEPVQDNNPIEQSKTTHQTSSTTIYPIFYPGKSIFTRFKLQKISQKFIFSNHHLARHVKVKTMDNRSADLHVDPKVFILPQINVHLTIFDILFKKEFSKIDIIQITIKDLKVEIQSALGYEPECQRLICKAKLLKDDETLDKYCKLSIFQAKHEFPIFEEFPLIMMCSDRRWRIYSCYGQPQSPNQQSEHHFSSN